MTDFPRCDVGPPGSPCFDESVLDGFLKVAAHPPNAWGLHDCHGNVEEWVSDWYDSSYYRTSPAVDPTGPSSGIHRVSRGGSHSTEVFYLRSANRMANFPDERTWLTGFRLVATPKDDATGSAPSTDSAIRPQSPPVAESIPTRQRDTPRPQSSNESAFFEGPLQYVNIEEGSMGPLWSNHNHDPALAIVPRSGDVVAVWFTTYTEPGREAALAMARLPHGAHAWTNATSLYDPADRCMCCPALHADPTSGELTLFSEQSPQAM